MSDEQAVAKTDEVAEPTSDENGAQDDLDALLSEYDQKVEKPDPKGESKPTDDDPLRKWAEQKMAEEAQQAVDNRLNEAVTAVSEGIEEIDEEDVEGFLHARARRDPRIAKAFEQASENPGQWKKVLGELSKAYKAKKGIDTSLTSDRQAVEAAIRGASTKAPDSEPDVGTMSNSEFETYKRKLARGK